MFGGPLSSKKPNQNKLKQTTTKQQQQEKKPKQNKTKNPEANK